MAAVGAAGKLAELENGGTVTVLEKMQKPGRKIMVSGKGRCNFTNVKSWEDFGEHVCNGASFIAPAFHNLTPENVVEFFRARWWRGETGLSPSHTSPETWWIPSCEHACSGASR